MFSSAVFGRLSGSIGGKHIAVAIGLNSVICQQVTTCRKRLLPHRDEHDDGSLLCKLHDCCSVLKAWPACPDTHLHLSFVFPSLNFRPANINITSFNTSSCLLISDLLYFVVPLSVFTAVLMLNE